ncbi:hypothetical protein SAMN02745165_01894 [Malonomonas rubra DSM 5091]|uniref:Chitin binding Peritrophin-A domain-containing protein n=1 Tax=Malonomonas rubra DSM 5091 TaxID=1122189 RepID=A0A1M6HNB2_MALRU|nr:hypothetical protein [Malonomonas rubra]SHJ23596.1 hypothetical protein SAMN02745165_01894 [Malonomonas rubra DSM 5091]
MKKIIFSVTALSFCFALLTAAVAVESSQPLCAKGEFVRELNRCQVAPPDEFSCPEGMNLDPIADKCFASPQCTSNLSYSPASGLCE